VRDDLWSASAKRRQGEADHEKLQSKQPESRLVRRDPERLQSVLPRSAIIAPDAMRSRWRARIRGCGQQWRKCWKIPFRQLF